MGCQYCNKSWVQGCWSADEAVTCGNLGDGEIRLALELAEALRAIKSMREANAADVENNERELLAKFKAKYEGKNGDSSC